MAQDLPITKGLLIPAAELQWRFSRASGAGGQHVNKVEKAVELVFDLTASKVIGPFRKQRIIDQIGSRLIGGCLRVSVSEQRSQFQNRQLALQRLADLLREGLKPPPKTRKPTKPSRGAKKRRMEDKKQRGQIKKARQSRPSMDE